MQLSDSHKALALSLGVYGLILTVTVALLWEQPVASQASASQPVAVTLAMFEAPRPEPTPVAETEPKTEPTPIPKPEPKPDPKPDPTPIPEPEPIPEPTPPKPEPKEEPKPEVQPDVAPAAQPMIEQTQPTIEDVPLKPQVSQRVIEEVEQLYLMELSTTLARHAQDSYPTLAQRRGWQGQVTVRFTLKANGNITDVNLVNSSGKKVLDDAALSIFTQRMQLFFKAFPPEITRTEWTHSIPIEYKLR